MHRHHGIEHRASPSDEILDQAANWLVRAWAVD